LKIVYAAQAAYTPSSQAERFKSSDFATPIQRQHVHWRFTVIPETIQSTSAFIRIDPVNGT